MTDELAAILREVVGAAIEWEYDPNGPDTWRCVFCRADEPVRYVPRAFTSRCGIPISHPPSDPFPHAPECVVVRAGALLTADAARKGGT